MEYAYISVIHKIFIFVLTLRWILWRKLMYSRVLLLVHYHLHDNLSQHIWSLNLNLSNIFLLLIDCSVDHLLSMYYVMNDNNNYLMDDLDLVYNLYIIKTEYYFENLGYTCKNHRMIMMMLNDNTFLLFIELFILFILGIR